MRATVICFLLLSVFLLHIYGHIQYQNPTFGVHCLNFTSLANEHDNVTEHYHCVECFYPQNCLANNVCRVGTTGTTCEKCLRAEAANDSQTGRYRLGSSCVPCHNIPWSAVSFGVCLLLILVTSCYHGFTESVAIKLKTLCHFLQYLLLTFHIKIDWSGKLLKLFAFINFGSFNSEMLEPDCLFPYIPSVCRHYLEWISSIFIVTFTLVVGMVIDQHHGMMKLSKIVQATDQEKETDFANFENWKTVVRRFVMTVIAVMYMPGIVSSIRTYLCSSVVPKLLVLNDTEDMFLLDNNISCNTFVFQTIQFFATLYLLLVGLLLPLLLVFFTLRQKKWKLLNTQHTLYGPLYESYRDLCCFWEAIPMLRKLIAVIITEAYPFSVFLQICVHLGLSGVYILLLVILRPYRSCWWKYRYVHIHIIFEVLSNLVVGLIQCMALSKVINHYQWYYDMIGIGAIGVIVVLWIALLLGIPYETWAVIPVVENSITEAKADLESSKNIKPKEKVSFLRKSNKVGHEPIFFKPIVKDKAVMEF